MAEKHWERGCVGGQEVKLLASSPLVRRRSGRVGLRLGTGGNALLLLGRGDPGKAAAAPSPATSCGLGARNCICFIFSAV